MGSNWPLNVLATILIVTVISKSECKSLYNECSSKGHFCMGSKNNVGAFKDTGCIKNHDCNIIVHATRTSDKKVTFEIGQVDNSWSYTLFVKDKNRIKYLKNVPQQVHMMEVNYGPKTGTPTVQTSIGAGAHTAPQNNGYGNGRFDLNFKDDLSRVQLKLFTFDTTTTPQGTGIDLDNDDLFPILVRTKSDLNYNLYDKIEGSAQKIFPGFGGKKGPIAPTATGSSPDGRYDKNDKKPFPWWWILVAIIIVAIIIAIICCCCCRKKGKKAVVSEEPTPSAVVSETPPSTSSRSTKTQPQTPNPGTSVVKAVVPKSTATGLKPLSRASAKNSKASTATKSKASTSPGKKSVASMK